MIRAGEAEIMASNPSLCEGPFRRARVQMPKELYHTLFFFANDVLSLNAQLAIHLFTSQLIIPSDYPIWVSGDIKQRLNANKLLMVKKVHLATLVVKRQHLL